MRRTIKPTVAVAVLLAYGPHPAAAQSVQQQFDAGQAALDGGRIDEAIRIFEALDARVAKGPPASRAAVRVRLGEALNTRGEYSRAQQLLNEALPQLTMDAMRPVRFDALRALGFAEESTLQFAAAEAHYREALAVPGADPAALLLTKAEAARVAIFSDPARAAAEFEALLAEAQSSKLKGETLAGYWDLLARAKLNAGDLTGARRAVEKAVALAGGLTARVSQADIAIRGDAAIIAWKQGERERAANFIAYTGAGLLSAATKSQDLSFPRELSPPPCGGADELKPEDSTIVQFSLSDEGQVLRATPIWSSRQGPAALAYARAVTEWRWGPQNAAAIQPFFRVAPRVQLRCTTAPERTPITPLLLPRFIQWARLNGIEAGEQIAAGSYSAEERRLRALLATRSDGLPSLGPLVALAALPTVNAAEAQQMMDRAMAIAVAQSAPAEARAWLGVRRAAAYRNRDDYRRAEGELTALAALGADPAIAADPRAAAYVALQRADLLRQRSEERQSMAALEPITRSLPADDALRQAAAVRLASFAAAVDDTATAQRWFAESGLDPSQCSLIDAEPVRRSAPTSGADYPPYASRAEGRVITEFDVDSLGRAQNVRAVFSYPPLLFEDSALNVARRARYEATYRPADDVGCRGYRGRINYLPARLQG